MCFLGIGGIHRDPLISFGALCFCLCLSAHAYCTPILPISLTHRHTHVHKHNFFPHYDLEESAELGGSRQQLSKPESQQAALHRRKGLLDRDNTMFSESDSPHQSQSRSVTDYPVFGRNEREEGKH